MQNGNYQFSILCDVTYKMKGEIYLGIVKSKLKNKRFIIEILDDKGKIIVSEIQEKNETLEDLSSRIIDLFKGESDEFKQS